MPPNSEISKGAGAFAPARLILATTDVMAAVFLMAMMGISFIDVIGRSFFRSPMPGATELTELAVAATISCIFPSLAYRGMHATIDVLDSFLPERFRTVQAAVINLLSAVAFGFTAWRVWIEGDKTARFGGETPLLEVPMAPVLYGMSILFAVAALAFLLAILKPLKVTDV